MTTSGNIFRTAQVFQDMNSDTAAINNVYGAGGQAVCSLSLAATSSASGSSRPV